MGDTECIAMSPARVDIIEVFPAPIAKHKLPGIQTGFLGNFADGRFNQRLACVLAARDRLPIAGVVGTLQ